MSIKINQLAIENVKRVKAVELEPSENGLTVIGGRNGQGKTSVLDAIAWALGGERYRPSNPQNTDSVIPPMLKVQLSNGIIVERKGKNATLYVTDPTGNKAGQKLLDSFVEELSLNLPKFMEMNNKDKAKTLLQIIGMEEVITKLEKKEQSLYQERLYKGREKEQKDKYAKELPYYDDVPNEQISAYTLIQQQQAILAKNGENQRKRDQLTQLKNSKQRYFNELCAYEDEIDRLQKLAQEKREQLSQIETDIKIGEKTVQELQDESTEEIKESIQNIEKINKKIQTNIEKKNAEEIAKKLEEEYQNLTQKIEDTRKEKMNLLQSANLPLAGLSVEDGELVYLGQKWDNMSSSEQLKVATSIVRSLNPNCGFVLIDKLEQMDEITMREFGKWLEKEDLQVIATRVTANEKECQIIIEDGLVVSENIEKEKKYEDIPW